MGLNDVFTDSADLTDSILHHGKLEFLGRYLHLNYFGKDSVYAFIFANCISLTKINTGN